MLLKLACLSQNFDSHINKITLFYYHLYTFLLINTILNDINLYLLRGITTNVPLTFNKSRKLMPAI
jgi:hypothetical protein